MPWAAPRKGSLAVDASAGAKFVGSCVCNTSLDWLEMLALVHSFCHSNDRLEGKGQCHCVSTVTELIVSLFNHCVVFLNASLQTILCLRVEVKKFFGL